MKIRISLTLLAVAAMMVFAHAQRGFGQRQFDPEKRAEHITKVLAEKLSLSENQKADLLKVNQDFSAKLKTHMTQQNMEEMKALRTEHHAAISKILTAEQKEIFDNHQPQHQGMRGGRGQFQKQNMEVRKAMMDELKSYRQENIQPVMLEQRAKLESKISKADKKAIIDLREKIAAKRKEHLEQRKEMAQQHHKHRKDAGMRAGHQGFKRGHSQGQGFGLMDDEMKKVAEKLVKSYGADIEKLFVEIAPKREQWQSDIKAIRETHRPKTAGFRQKTQAEPKSPSEEMKTRRDFHRKLSFLLMKAENNTESFGVQPDRKVNVFPNPAGSTQFIEFEVLNPGLVNVEIVDQLGNIVKSVYKGELPKGMNKLEVNVGELKGNMYYYRITDTKGITSKPFIR